MLENKLIKSLHEHKGPSLPPLALPVKNGHLPAELKFRENTASSRQLEEPEPLGYSKPMFLFFVLYQLMLSGNVYGSEIQHGIFGGLNFGPGIF